MPMLTDIWGISYGSIQFPLYSKSTLQGQPVYDTSRRTVSFIKYSLEVESTLTADPAAGSVESQLVQIRQQLQTRGSTLEIQNTGFGHVRVNSLAGLNVKGVDFKDVAYGPHPEILSARPLGSRLAWHIEWRCTFNIPECAEGTAVFLGRPMEFTYTWAVHQDRHGFSTRTVSGQLVIPATTIKGQKVPPDQADKYWTNIVASCPPLPSFTREEDHTLSEDRRTLRFTLTDTELPANAFVAGATEWSGTQELSTNLQSGFQTWACGISATYQAARGQGKADLYLKQFIPLVSSRLIAARPPNSNGAPMPLDFRITDQLHSQEVTFAFRWTYTTGVNKALAASGLWTALPGVGWAPWAASMARTVLNARGNAQLAYNAASDTLIDLCAAESSVVLTSSGLPGEKVLRPGLLGGGGANQALQGTLPPADQSWIYYQCGIRYLEDTGVHVLRPLPPTPRLIQVKKVKGGFQEVDPVQPVLGAGKGKLVNKINNKSKILTFVAPPLAGEGTCIIQQRTIPAVRAIVYGRAVRAGYPIVPPALLGVGGVPAVLKQPRHDQSIVGDAGGVPIIQTRWSDEYVLAAEGDGTLPLPGNPLFDLT